MAHSLSYWRAFQSAWVHHDQRSAGAGGQGLGIASIGCCLCRVYLFYAPLVASAPSKRTLLSSFGFSSGCANAPILLMALTLFNWTERSARIRWSQLLHLPPFDHPTDLAIFRSHSLSRSLALPLCAALSPTRPLVAGAGSQWACVWGCLICRSYVELCKTYIRSIFDFRERFFIEKHLERDSSCSVEVKPWYRVDYYL